MNKATRIYTIAWSIVLVVFNAIVFVTPNLARHFSAFWIGYTFIMVAYVGHLFCTRYALRDDEGHKLFYGIPIILVSYIGLAIMLVAGGMGMIIPGFPWWLSVILSLAALGFLALAVLIAGSAGEIVFGIDRKVKTASHTFRNLTADADHLRVEAKTNELKAIAKKVYEAIRYSDVMSSHMLYEINERILLQFEAFADAIHEEDLELSAEIATELLNLIDERNKKCKLLK